MAIIRVGVIPGLAIPRPNINCYPNSRRVSRCNYATSSSDKLAAIAVAAAAAAALTLHPLSSSAAATDLPSNTPFSQSKNLPTGLLNGKIRPCPSVNPCCVSTNPSSSSFAFPWRIPQSALDANANAIDVVRQLQYAILKTQKNAKIQLVEDTPYGNYIKAEIDGGFGRDVLEFLVKEDVVAYRAMATKVTYVYPFTTAFGDSKGQEERMKKLVEELGWYSPSFDTID